LLIFGCFGIYIFCPNSGVIINLYIPKYGISIKRGGIMVKNLYHGEKFDGIKKTVSYLSVALHLIEVFLAIIVIAVVIVGLIVLLQSVAHTRLQGGEGFPHMVETILSNILLLIIGIELAILLIRRTPESLVEVMFFVVARKMLIKSDSVYDLLVGVAAIAGLFAVRKYLEHVTPDRQLLSVSESKKGK